MKSTRQRESERRKQRLDEVQRQLDEGSLTIRKMTPEERAEHPARPRPERGRRS